MPDEISKTGLWLDADGKVVKKKPEGGSTQIVREGGRISSSARVLLDSVDADPNAKPLSAAEALGHDPAPSPDTSEDKGKTVETVKSSKSSK